MVAESARSSPATAPRKRSDATMAPAPGGVDVVPQPVACGEISAGIQRIDHAGVAGPRGGDDQEGYAACGEILVNPLLECCRRHAAAAVGRYVMRSGAADPNLMRDLDPAAVTLLGGVEDRRPRKSARAIGRERRMRAGQRA